MKRYSFLLAVLMLSLSAFAGKIDEGRLLRDGASYTGRVLHNADGSVTYDWTGVYVQTDFTGGAIAVCISEADTSYHNVFIDDKLVRKIKVYGKQPHSVLLAEGLSRGTHRLRLQKATEGEYGFTTIHGFYLNRGGSMKPVAPRERFIEVFGDSYTCGYGTEAKSAEERFKPWTENCNRAYGCIIARYFNADYALTAHSGMGIVRNYGYKAQVSPKNMLVRSALLLDEHDSIPYDFKAYKPSLVLINLGTNDFSTIIAPSVEQYTGNYLKLISLVRSHYGDVPVLCITPFSAKPYLLTALEELRRLTMQDKNIHFAEPMPDIIKRGHDYGADWHPNYQGQRKIAMTLIPQVSAIMGWDLEDKNIY